MFTISGILAVISLLANRDWMRVDKPEIDGWDCADASLIKWYRWGDGSEDSGICLKGGGGGVIIK